MSKFNHEYIVEEQQQTSDAQTWEKTLPRTGVLSALEIRVSATNGATSNKDSPIFECVKKIEVIGNGSEVIYSTTGKENIVLNWLKTGRRLPENISEAPNDVQYNTYRILFGRYIGDEQCGLDLSKWRDVTLKITYDLEAVNSTGSTGFVSGSCKISVIAWRAPANMGLSPVGYVKVSEVKTFTSADSGVEEIELPLAHKYIGIGVYAREAGVADGTDITKLELDLNNGERILFTSEWLHLQEQNAHMFDVDPEVQGIIYKSDTDTFYTYTGTVKHVDLRPIEDVDLTNDTFQIWNIDTISGDQCTINASQADVTAGAEDLTAYTTDTAVRWRASGIGVGNFVYIPIDVKRDFSMLLDSKQYGSIKLKLTQGGAGATVGVVLEELVTS